MVVVFYCCKFSFNVGNHFFAAITTAPIPEESTESTEILLVEEEAEKRLPKQEGGSQNILFLILNIILV